MLYGVMYKVFEKSIPRLWIDDDNQDTYSSKALAIKLLNVLHKRYCMSGGTKVFHTLGITEVVENDPRSLLGKAERVIEKRIMDKYHRAGMLRSTPPGKAL